MDTNYHKETQIKNILLDQSAFPFKLNQQKFIDRVKAFFTTNTKVLSYRVS